MNELIQKLQTEAAELVAAKEAAILAANADGVTEEDAAKHVQTAETANAKLKDVTAKLNAAVETRDQRAALAAHVERERQPGTSPIIAKPFTGHGEAGAMRRPAVPRRHAPLKAFRGQDADLHAYQTGLFVAGCFFGHRPSLERLAEYGIAPQATLNTANNGQGGYFVPDVMDNAILVLTEEYGVFRRSADVVPMSSDTWSGPRWTNTLVASWVAEGAAPANVTEPTFDRVQLVAKNLTAYGKMTRQLNEDALVNLGDVWANAAALAFSQAEDDAAFNGDGTSAFGGITGLLPKLRDSANAASVVTAGTGRNTLAALTLPDYWAVIGKYPSYPGANPRWYCHKEVWAASMGPLQTAAGGVTEQGVQNGGAARFLGYPVELVNVMPKAASFAAGYTGIIFGDLSLSSKFGDRRQRSLEVGLINDDLIKQLMTLFTAERVDVLNHTITDPKNSSNAGPVLGLKLAA